MNKKKSGLQLQWEAGIRNKSKMVLYGSSQYFEALKKVLNQNKDE
jgi:hypothetical protein